MKLSNALAPLFMSLVSVSVVHQLWTRPGLAQNFATPQQTPSSPTSGGGSGGGGSGKSPIDIPTVVINFPNPIPCGVKGTAEREDAIFKALGRLSKVCSDMNAGIYDEQIAAVAPQGLQMKCPSSECFAVRRVGTGSSTTFETVVSIDNRRIVTNEDGSAASDNGSTTFPDSRSDGSGSSGGFPGGTSRGQSTELNLQFKLSFSTEHYEEMLCVGPMYSPAFSVAVMNIFSSRCAD